MQPIDLVPDLRPVILAARALRDERNSLERFLPNTAVMALSYRLGRRRKVDQTVPVRSFGSPATPIKRPGVVEVRGDLPAITPIVNLTETDLNQEFVLAQMLNGQQVDWAPWVEQAAALVALATDNTYELMRGQALSAGAVSLEVEDGAIHEVDYEVAAEQKIAVDAGDNFWEAFEAGHEVFHDTSGAPAGVFLTTAKVYRKALASLQTMFPQQPVGETSLNAYAADRGLPTFITYDRVLRAEDGSKTRIYPEGHGTFLPAGDAIGRTELGVTQEAVQQVQNRILSPVEVAGMTVQTLGQDNPVERAVKGASVGLPVIQDNEDIVILSGLEATV
jgi:hypothetical protein